MTVLYKKRTTVQAVLETTYGVTPAFANTDGVLVIEPAFNADIDTLKRDIVQADFSPQSSIIGRKTAKMKFQVELRSNGKNTGVLGDAPMIARLFRACGMALSARPQPSLSAVFDKDDPAVAVAWTTDENTLVTDDVVPYLITVTTGGASATAKCSISSDVAGESSTNVTLTSGGVLNLGTKGAKATPVWTGNLVVGQKWYLWAFPKGLRLDPVSDNQQSISLRGNMSGVAHLLPGARGTFTIKAEAAKFATVDFEFTGLYNPPADQALPALAFERTLPAKVEMARLMIDNFKAVAKSFTFDMKNEVTIREDVSSAEGYIGIELSDRDPEAGFDPEADLVANHDFWGKLSTASRMPFQMRVGTVPGNTVWVLIPSAQYSGLSYQDRNKILTYQAGLSVSRVNGNDEVCIFLG